MRQRSVQCIGTVYIPVAKNNSGWENQDIALILQESLDQLTDVLL